MLQTWTTWLRKESGRQKEKEVRCKCCGECCQFFGMNLRASAADREKWQSLGRDDLLRRVNRLGWIWVDPETGRLEPQCPFLQRLDPQTAVCSIHEVKPEMCRSYPTLAHGKRCLHGTFLSTITGGMVNFTELAEVLQSWAVEIQPILCSL